jgi:amino acid transporter
MVATCGGETAHPEITIPRAAKAFAARLAVAYVISILGVTLTCPSDAPEIVSGHAGAGSSPFVIGIKTAGIKTLDHIVNSIILCSAWSAGNVYMYLASRSLYSLAVAGNAPGIFARTNRWNVPFWAVTSTAVIALLAYLNVSSGAGEVFNWLVNMINMAAFFSWILLSASYLRFRTALDAQGVDRAALPYLSVCGRPGAWFCIVFCSVFGLLNGFNVFFPGQWDVSGFLTAYIGTALFVVLFVGHKLTVGRNDSWFVPVDEINLKFTPAGRPTILSAATADVECAPSWGRLRALVGGKGR